MISQLLVVKLVVALVALGVSVYMARWHRRSRAEWRAYDDEHHADRPLRPSAAASRAEHDR